MTQYFKADARLIVLKVFRLLPCLALLWSCQPDSGVDAEKLNLLQRKKDAASYNIQLGMAYLKQGDRVRAKRKLLTAMTLAPNSANVNVAMAYYLEKTGEMNEADKLYRKAIALEPTSGAQLNNYGTFLCRLEKYQAAEEYFLKAVRDVQYLHTAGAYENAGLCVAAIPDYPKAKAYFRKALEHDPQRKQSLYELVAIEFKQDQASVALGYLQSYPELVLNDSTLLAMAVDVAHQAGKTTEELAYKQRLSRLRNFTDYTGAKNEYDSNNG